MRGGGSKFFSAVSLMGIVAMLALYFYVLPEFLLSAKGRIFAAVWLVFAVAMLWAHFLNLPAVFRLNMKTALKKQRMQVKIRDSRTGKNVRAVRAMRG